MVQIHFVAKIARLMFAIGLVIVIYQAADKGFFLGNIGGLLLGISAFLDWGEDSH